MPNSYLPLSWESTGDQWWFATPIDWAAANGLCDLVKELLNIDPDLLIKLTSLRRIRRLETVWEDNIGPGEVAQCRARVARSLLLDCDRRSGDGDGKRQNVLVLAGYGGWLMYSAASAGDVGFVRDLLERDPLLVFGQGEYGIADVLYAAARSRNSEVFKLLLEFGVDVSKGGCGTDESFAEEMMNRAVHAAARAGNLVVLHELLFGCSDVLGYRDVQRSTILHSAAATGQVEVVKDIIATYDIINSIDNQGNTALHVAAYRGHSSVVEALAYTSPSLVTSRNNDGDTFLHMAVAGFRYPGFHRIHQQIELMKQLVSGNIIGLNDVINVRNNEGRAALHIAIAENIQCNVVELLLGVPAIDLNIRDNDGFTAVDLLKQCPKTPSSEILMRQLASAGGISDCQGETVRNALVRNLRIQGTGTSPGTSFRVPDAELFSYAEDGHGSDNSCEPLSSRFSSGSSEQTTTHLDSANGLDVADSRRRSSLSISASRKFMSLIQWPRKSESSLNGRGTELSIVCRNDDTLTPLRQKFSRRRDLPSPSTREKFAASLMQGVIQATPPPSGLSSAQYSPWSRFSESLASSPNSAEKLKGNHVKSSTSARSKFFSGPLNVGKAEENDKHRRVSSFNKSLMNQYFCFGAQGLAVEDSVTCRRGNSSSRRLVF